MVERCVRDAEAAGSNPVASTMLIVLNGLELLRTIFFMHISIFYVSEQVTVTTGLLIFTA